MKHFTFLLAAFTFTSTVFAQQQLNNNNFNGKWSEDANKQSVQPESWNSLNWNAKGGFGSMKGGSVTKGIGTDETNFYPIITNKWSGTQTWGQKTGYIHPGILSLGTPWTYINTNYFSASKGEVGVDGGIKFTDRPSKVIFKATYFKSPAAKNDKDGANIRVYLWKGTSKSTDINKAEHIDEMTSVWNSANGATLIGKGELIINNDIENFTEQTIQINYLTNDVPEKMNIVFCASNYINQPKDPLTTVAESNELCIDDVTLVYNTGIEDIHSNELNVAVNNSGLRINTDENVSIAIYNVLGQLLAQGKTNTGYFEYNFKPGQVYFIKINNKTIKVSVL